MLTIEKLKEKIAQAEADGLPVSAAVLFDGAAVSDQVIVEVGKYTLQPDGTQEVQVAPSFGLQHAV